MGVLGEAWVVLARAGSSVRGRMGDPGGLLRELAHDESGQGTTEYAILVGVLVVIAILAIVTFRGKVQELWDAIADGIGQL